MINQPKEIDSTCKLIWRKPISPDSQTAQIASPIINAEGNIVVSFWGTSASPNRECFELFDGNTGNIIWKWDDYLRNESGFSNRSREVIDNSLILSNWNATYSFDLITGMTNWKHFYDTMYGSTALYSSNDKHVYHGFQGEKGRYSFHLFRTVPESPYWELCYQHFDTLKLHDKISESSISFYEGINGNQLAYITLVSYTSFQNRLVQLACYNLTEKRIIWNKDYSSEFDQFDQRDSKIINGKLYQFATGTDGFFYLVTFDIETGDIIWKKKLNDYGVNIFSYQEKVIVICANNSPIIALSNTNGDLVWRQDFEIPEKAWLFFGFNDVNLYKHYLFLTLHRNIMILDIYDGRIIFIQKIVDDTSTVGEGVAINEAKRCFYVQDGKYLNCYKFPDIIK